MLDEPEISDYEYDMLYAELLRLEAEHPELYDPDSPTQRVGGQALEKFEKVTHTAVMNSLSDVFSFDELDDFMARTAEAVGEQDFSCLNRRLTDFRFALTYEQRHFIRVDRGDGVTAKM